MSARPVAREDIITLFKDLNDKENIKKKRKYTCSDILDVNVILAEQTDTSYNLIWWDMSRIRTLKFSKRSKMPDIRVQVPPMLYVASGKHLQIFHLQENLRPTEKCKIYDCILPNTMHGNDICFGSVERQIPMEATFKQLITLWENYYWNSYFTSSGLVDKTLKEWKRIAASKSKAVLTFNQNLLKQAKEKTVKGIINNLNR